MNAEIYEIIMDGLKEKPNELRWSQGFPVDDIEYDYFSEITKEDLFKIIRSMDYVMCKAHLSDSYELYSMLRDELQNDFDYVENDYD